MAHSHMLTSWSLSHGTLTHAHLMESVSWHTHTCSPHGVCLMAHSHMLTSWSLSHGTLTHAHLMESVSWHTHTCSPHGVCLMAHSHMLTSWSLSHGTLTHAHLMDSVSWHTHTCSPHGVCLMWYETVCGVGLSLQILSRADSRELHGYDAMAVLTLLINYRKYEVRYYQSVDSASVLCLGLYMVPCLCLYLIT